MKEQQSFFTINYLTKNSTNIQMMQTHASGNVHLCMLNFVIAFFTVNQSILLPASLLFSEISGERELKVLHCSYPI